MSWVHTVNKTTFVEHLYFTPLRHSLSNLSSFVCHNQVSWCPPIYRITFIVSTKAFAAVCQFYVGAIFFVTPSSPFKQTHTPLSTLLTPFFLFPKPCITVKEAVSLLLPLITSGFLRLAPMRVLLNWLPLPTMFCCLAVSYLLLFKLECGVSLIAQSSLSFLCTVRPGLNGLIVLQQHKAQI